LQHGEKVGMRKKANKKLHQ